MVDRRLWKAGASKTTPAPGCHSVEGYGPAMSCLKQTQIYPIPCTIIWWLQRIRNGIMCCCKSKFGKTRACTGVGLGLIAISCKLRLLNNVLPKTMFSCVQSKTTVNLATTSSTRLMGRAVPRCWWSTLHPGASGARWTCLWRRPSYSKSVCVSSKQTVLITSQHDLLCSSTC